jgi:hypothetical protein
MKLKNRFTKPLYIISTILISMVTMADIYPGDTAYNAIVQNIYHGVSADNINLVYDQSIHTRTQLCVKLTDQHNNGTPGVATQTNAALINQTITVADCLNALWFSQGYNSSTGLAAWKGNLSGSWYADNGATFNDPAIWKAPISVQTGDPQNDLDNNGNPRVYVFQQVVFSARTGAAKYGWNQSHHEVAYIWGWDGKDNNSEPVNGDVGTHVGWTFNQGTAKCIIWVTKKEAFLECVKTVGAVKKRTSAGFFGIGQWTIAPLAPIILPPRRVKFDLQF